MKNISVNILRYRLTLKVTKRRSVALPGNEMSRFFRHVFAHKHLKRLLGSNLALAIVASSFLPSQASAAFSEADQAIIAIQETPLTTSRGVQFPLEKVIVTQGYRIFHPAIDFDGKTGDPIRPVMAGVVADISRSRFGYGNAIIINHGNQIMSLYAHLSKIEVKVGDEVSLQTKIGELGSTGHSTGDHLHLEIRDHGIPINPYTILSLR